MSSTTTDTTSAPASTAAVGQAGLVPYLAVHDGPAALEFYESAFGAEVTLRFDGDDGRVGHADLVIGNGINILGPGEVVRAVDFPAHALAAVTGFRKIALADLGRSGAVVTGRIDPDGSTVFGITAATEWPTVLRYPRPPAADLLRHDISTAPGYYTDPLGSADWRRGVSAVLAEEIRLELTGTR